MKDRHLGWKTDSHRRCSSDFLSHCLCLLEWQQHGCLSIIQDPVCLHGQSFLSHFFTRSRVHLSVNEARLVRSCNIFIWLADAVGRRMEDNMKNLCPWKLYNCLNCIYCSKKIYYFSQQLVLLISLDCCDHRFCYFNDPILNLCGPRAAFLLSAHLHWHPF